MRHLTENSATCSTGLDRRRSDPALHAPDLDALVVYVWAASNHDADRVHAALAAWAPVDATAARVLLQILRPGMRNLGRRLALGAAFNDVDHELLGLAWERIRTYPIATHFIAANVFFDVRKRYIRSAIAAVTVPLDAIPMAQPPTRPPQNTTRWTATDRASTEPTSVSPRPSTAAPSHRLAPPSCGVRASSRMTTLTLPPSSA